MEKLTNLERSFASENTIYSEINSVSMFLKLPHLNLKHKGRYHG